MAKQLEPASVTREERTFRVERETPADGNYRLRIHRQTVTRIGNEVIATTERTFAYDEPVALALGRKAAVKYLAAVNAAKSLPEVMAAEAQLYDDLVAEVDAELEEAKRVEAASIEAERIEAERIEADPKRTRAEPWQPP
jgi:hypothetical protein